MPSEFSISALLGRRVAEKDTKWYQEEKRTHTASQVGLAACHVRKWARRFLEQGVTSLSEKLRPGHAPLFLPKVALQIVKLACEHPDQLGYLLSQWDCSELARKLQADGIVPSFSPATVRRVLQAHQLKPWRSHLWLFPKVPRNQQFVEQIRTVVDVYTCPLNEEELVLSLDEKTNLQPRSRLAPTLPSRPGQPLRLELSINEQEHCICLRPLIPALGRSMHEQSYTNAKSSLSPFFLSCSRSFPRVA